MQQEGNQVEEVRLLCESCGGDECVVHSLSFC